MLNSIVLIENTIILNKAIEFLPSVWDEKNGKFTQFKIAEKLGCTTAYLSKAKANENYARLLNPKLITIIEELGGQYIEEENVFIDKEGKRFEIISEADRVDYGLHRMTNKWVRKILARKTKELCILTTWIGETAEDIMQIFNSKPELLRKIESVKILMLSPDSQMSYFRSKSMGINTSQGFNKIRSDIQAIYEHHERLNEILPNSIKRPKIEIRLYDELSSVQLIMTDSKILLGFYLQGLASKNVDNLVIERDKSEFVRQMENHFDTIWNKYKHTSLKIEDIQPKIENLTDPPYKRFNIHRYSGFVGTYYLYYAERYSPTEYNDYRTHKTSATIGCNILHIEENIEGVFKCRMKAAGVDDSEQEYYGELTNINFNSPDYLILTLTNKTKTRHLSLYFTIKNKGKNDYLFGLFSVIYKTSGRCGSGFSVLKEAEKMYKNLIPTSIDSNDMPLEHKKNLPTVLVSYLIDKQESLILSVASVEQIKSKGIFKEIAGTYYVYAYSGNNKTAQITQGVATVYESGMLEYKNRINGYDGVGWVKIDKAKDKIYVEVRNSNLKIKRTALFIIDRRPLDQKEIYYGGVCASTTWNKGVPVAARIILQRTKIKGFREVEPKKITIDSEDYVKLPLLVKKELTGIAPNMIGHFKKKRKIELSETFYKAACYDADKKDAESFLINLKHAVTHGFNDLERLKIFKTQMPDQITEINRIKRIMDKMQKRTRGN